MTTSEYTDYAWRNVEEALHSRVLDVFKRILSNFKRQKVGKLVSRLRRLQ